MKKTARSQSKKIRKSKAKAGADGPSAPLAVPRAPEKGSSGADKKVGRPNANPDLYLFDSKTLAQLAVGSSVVIATLLSLSDGVALIPGATSLVSWTLKLIGNWVICAVLWFVGFGALAQLLRLISRGVMANARGIKLSIFDRLIQWSDIQAISLEPNIFFTRIFSLKVPARRLTIFFRLTEKNKMLANLLFPNFVPSFFFTKETFDALVRTVFEKSQILPASALPETLDNEYAIFAFRREQLPTVRRTSVWLAKQRIIVTLIVAISLIAFLGRKAAVNYAYNSGQKAYREGRLEKAIEYYSLATKFEPTFAAAWNAMGQCEFHLAETNLTDFDKARKDWKVALLCKPDLVEAKLNLTRLALGQRKFSEAADQLEHALFFDPQNVLALLEKAELDIRRGDGAAGLKGARLVVSENDPSRKKIVVIPEYLFLANMLIAQAKLDMRDVSGALADLKPYSDDPADYRQGQNITYMYIVKSRAFVAAGDYKQAEKLALAAAKRQPRNEEALAQVALVEVELGNFALAEQYLAQDRALLVPDPWLSIIYGREMIKQNQLGDAIHAYADALVVPDTSQDAYALASINRELSPIFAQDKQGTDQLTNLKAEAKGRAEKINGQIFKYF